MKSLRTPWTVLLMILAAQLCPSSLIAQGAEKLRAEIESLRPQNHVWRQIKWINCPLEALQLSRQQQKPVLAWVFLGNPADERCWVFAGAVRETVFSRPDVIQQVNAEFIPLAVKATLANQVSAAGDSQEDRFYGRLKSVQVAPQGICALNSDGQVLIWTEMFDDDKSISSFLDHTLRVRVV